MLADLTSYRDRVNDNHKRLLALFGQLKEVALPSDDEIKQLVDDSINSVGLPVERLPFSKDAAYASFLGTIDKRRPSHKKQQFKDGVLWEDCKTLARQENLVLITNDRAFFEDDDLKLGLASELACEIADEGLNIRLLPSLTDLLAEIRQPVEVSQEQLRDDLETQLGAQLSQPAEKKGFSRGNDIDLHVEHFATEDPALLFVNVSGSYQCEDVSGANRPMATLRFKCDGSFSTREKTFAELSPTLLELDYIDEDGQKISDRHIFGRMAGIELGHRTIGHHVRQPLNE